MPALVVMVSLAETAVDTGLAEICSVTLWPSCSRIGSGPVPENAAFENERVLMVMAPPRAVSVRG